jgi:hypothetical protein
MWRRPLACGFVVERVTRIELALSAWESDRIASLEGLTWRFDCPCLPVTDPWFPGLMARQWPGDLVSCASNDLWPLPILRLKRQALASSFSKPSRRVACQRCGLSDLGATVRRWPMASTVG